MTVTVGHADTSQAASVLRNAMALKRRKGSKPPPTPKTLTKKQWPPDYDSVMQWRHEQVQSLTNNKEQLRAAKKFYKNNPEAFINDWCDTWDTRNTATDTPVRIPFILFLKQGELIEFIMACFNGNANGLVEKSRDMGATWVCVALSVWLWLFWPGTSVGWGSNKADKVDRLGDPSSIFEKIRMLIGVIPSVFLPDGLKADKHLLSKRILNPVNGSSIIGEIGKSIGRGGRTRIYFLDESAHLDKPEQIEASLSETTRVRIDLSSVSGLGTVFHRTRKAGKVWVKGAEVHRDCANVFIMDWRDHPAKTKEWYAERVQNYTSRGLMHIVARELDRDYAASQEGVLIPHEWVLAAVDADKVLGFNDEGESIGGLDVADGGQDANAFARRKGSILKHLNTWEYATDTGVTTRRAVGLCTTDLPCRIQYDAIGVGSGIKAESNRLKEDEKLPAGISFTPWLAGGRVLNPGTYVIPGDKQTPLVQDFYENIKSQAWWELRTRFYKTWMAVTQGAKYPPEELISLCSKSLGAMLIPLQEELSQPTYGYSTKMKIVINKAPDGTRSPNLADAVVMAFWPMPLGFRGLDDFHGPRIISASRDTR